MYAFNIGALFTTVFNTGSSFGSKAVLVIYCEIHCHFSVFILLEPTSKFLRLCLSFIQNVWIIQSYNHWNFADR